jgi:hypothetical protein
MAMRQFITRNRRDQPHTTELDEMVDGKLTGKVVTNYGFNGNDFVVQYKGETKIGMENIQNREETQVIQQVIPENFKKTFKVTFDWQMGVEEIVGFGSISAAKGYQEELIKKFPWAKVENFEVFEVRYVERKI